MPKRTSSFYHIEPQADLLKNKDTDETQFELCDEQDAELFAVFKDQELIEDFDDRELAAAFVLCEIFMHLPDNN